MNTGLFSWVRRPDYALLAAALLILIFYGLFLGHRINLTTADLGRHIKNGEETVGAHTILADNFYSYTAPGFSAPNHHWGSGVAFYALWRAAGFTGLQVASTALLLATLLIFFRIAAEDAGPGPAAIAALAALPLLAERTEIRPEIFSYFFSALFFATLLRYRTAQNPRALVALPILQIFWVNMHIYFFLGPVLVAAFALEALLLARRGTPRDHTLLWLLSTCVAATVINPFGGRGALAPFTIFRNYGYLVAENQPVWFVERLLANPNFTLFKIAFFLLAATFIARLRAPNNRFSLPHILIGATFGAMAWLAVRNFALFGFFFIPLVAANIRAAAEPFWEQKRSLIAWGAASAITLLIIPAFFGQWQKYFPYWREQGLGLEQGSGDGARFFRENNLHGPLFNNYDIGGYLIFHLFPGERVFVDNRPEAYPASFFTDTYIPMQERDDIWRKELARWNFNAIFFSWRDATPWAQTFLGARIRDPEWTPVFADKSTIIFLRNYEANKDLIARFALPKDMFRMEPR